MFYLIKKYYQGFKNLVSSFLFTTKYKDSFSGVIIERIVDINSVDPYYLSRLIKNLLFDLIRKNYKYLKNLPNEHDSYIYNIVIVTTFQAGGGFRPENIPLYNTSLKNIDDLNEYEVVSSIHTRLDDLIEKYKISYFEKIEIKIL